MVEGQRQIPLAIGAGALRRACNRVQDAFRVVLQKNMMVLATAHAVSEGIMRRLSGDLARKASPQVYGASGRTGAEPEAWPAARHQPLAVGTIAE